MKEIGHSINLFDITSDREKSNNVVLISSTSSSPAFSVLYSAPTSTNKICLSSTSAGSLESSETSILPQHVPSLLPFSTYFNLHQRSNYSTHIKGGILDLVFDDKRDSDVEWMFSPYSDHFILLVEL